MFFVMLFVSSLFGMLGGLFGALMFRKKPPVIPPPIPPTSDGGIVRRAPGRGGRNDSRRRADTRSGMDSTKQDYAAFFRFAQRPFSLTPDPKFYFRSRSHSRVFDALSAAIARRDSVMLVLGDLGVGKTTLCRTLLDLQERKSRVGARRQRAAVAGRPAAPDAPGSWRGVERRGASRAGWPPRRACSWSRCSISSSAGCARRAMARC